MTDRKALAVGITSKAIQLVFSILVARLIAPDDYGAASAIILACTLLLAMAELAAPESIIRRSHLSVRFLLGYLLAAGLVLAISVFALLRFDIVTEIMGGQTDALLPVVGLSVLIILSVYLDAVVRRAHKFMLLAVRTLTCTVVSSLVGLTLAAWGYGYAALLIQAFVFAGLNVLMLLATVADLKDTFSSEKPTEPSFLHFAIPLYLQRILDAVATRGADLLVIAQLGLHQYGLFVLSFRLAQTLLQTITAPYNEILFARLARASSGDDAAKQRFRAAFKTVLGCVSSVFCILAVSAPEVVRLLYGERWSDTGPVLSVPLFLGALQAAQFLNGPFILTQSGSPGLLAITLVKSFSAIGLLVAFPPENALDAAIIMILGQAISTPLSYFLTLRALRIGPLSLLRDSIPPLSMVAIATGLALACKASATASALPLPAIIVVSVSVPFAAILALASRFDPLVSSDLQRASLWLRQRVR